MSRMMARTLSVTPSVGVSQSGWVRSRVVVKLRWLGRGRRGQDVVAVGVYVAVWLLFVGRDAVGNPGHICACGGGADATLFMWALVWWPHALLHGLNPFVSHVIWTPGGANLAAASSVPAASLILSPVTAAFGPIVAFNVLAFLGPVLGAWFAFRLCRYVTGAWLPSLLGGYIFGFSSYELGQLGGHLHLVSIFLVPAAVHLVLLWLDDAVSDRRFLVLMTAILILQVGLSTEILLSMLMFGGVSLLLAYFVCGSARRRRIAAMVPKLLFAGVAAMVLVSPFLYYAFKGLGPTPSLNWSANANVFSADPLNYVLPTPVTWLGHQLVGSVAAKFNAPGGSPVFAESGAYVGLPLLAIVVLYLIENRRRAGAKVLLGTLIVTGVASLGGYLHIANPPPYQPTIRLPWFSITHIPGFDHLLPVRFTMYVSLIVALIVALWLAQPVAKRWPRWLLAGVGVALLLPNVTLYWHNQYRLGDPQFFTSSLYKRYLRPNETVLALPYGQSGFSMLWQARTDMYFRMAGGYISPEIPPDYYPREPLLPNLFSPLGEGPVPPQRLVPMLGDFVRRRHIGAIIVDARDSGAWASLLTGFGLRHTHVGGVLFYPIPTGPAILNVSPARGATGLSTRTTVYAVFSEPMDHASTQRAFALMRSTDNTAVQGRLSWFTDKVLVFTPARPLAHRSQYAATVAGTAEDQLAQALAKPTTWHFMTK
jgi:hypothetical protein